jgi:intein/homing endonuclease
MLTEQFLSKYADFPPEMTPLGMFVFLRTYSRYLTKHKRRETYKETCLRATLYNMRLVVDHLNTISYQIDWNQLSQEACLLFDNTYHLRQFLSGRTMWIGGTPAADRYSLSNFNCSALNITKWDDLCDLFYLLMVGTGVGFKSNQQLLSQMTKIRINLKLIHSQYQPLPKHERLEHTKLMVLTNGFAKIYIGDSKEGWVEGLRSYLQILTQPNYEYVHTIKISYNSVRPRGERLKTFGGTSSGHEPLEGMFVGIDKTLKSQLDPWLVPLVPDHKGYVSLRPIHIMDIGNLIGQNVVVGGVRRCLPAGSLVHLKRGLVPIEKVQGGDQVLTTQGYKLVTDWFEQGERDLVKIVTQDGDFTCTPNHRMPVLTSFNEYQWVEASQLQPGQRLISTRTPIEGVKTTLPEWTYGRISSTPDIKEIIVPELDEDMAWFIGLFSTGGNICPSSGTDDFGSDVSFHFGVNETSITNKAKIQMQRFGSDLKVSLKKSCIEEMLIVKCKSKQLAWYLNRNVKQSNRVPDWILQAKNSIKLAYIAGILDGCTDHQTIYVATIYEDFARDIQKVLYSCGIESRLHIQTTVPPNRNGWQNIYKITLITNRSVRLIRAIPQLQKSLRIGSSSQKVNGYPSEFRSQGDHQLTVDYYEKETGNESLLCPVEVVEVKPAGKGYTYDITVDGPNEAQGTHEFFVNGLLSHNTAEIFLFEADDYEVLFAKYGLNGIYTQEQFEHHIQLGQDLDKMGIKPSWFDQMTAMYQKDGTAVRTGLDHRHLSNNSIMFKQRPTLDYLKLLIKILRYEGEPGLINMEEMKRRRPNAELLNPCAEIILDSYQTCNLTTVNLTQFVGTDPLGNPRLNTDDLYEAQKLSVRAGIRMTLINLELPVWDQKQKRDRLIGASLTGIKDTMDRLGYTKQQEIQVIHNLGDVARQEAIRYAKEIRIASPLLATTIKPEGSLSQLAGCVSQGLHLSHSPFFIRRIRINSNDPMVDVIRKAKWRINPEVGTLGANYEEKMANARTYVIDFPVTSHAKKTKYQSNIEEQLDTYFTYQRYYADHNCSNTITVKPEEWEQLPQIIYNRWNEYLGITFIPLDGGNYELAPYEECTQSTYNQMKAEMGVFDTKLLEHLDQQLHIDDASDASVAVPVDETFKSECAGGVCPMR